MNLSSASEIGHQEFGLLQPDTAHDTCNIWDVETIFEYTKLSGCSRDYVYSLTTFAMSHWGII